MAVHVGAIGKKIILNVTATISSSTVRRIYYEKPDSNTRAYWDAVEESSTSISYTTLLATDLDKVGKWRLHAYVEYPGYKLMGEEVVMTVKRSIRSILEGLISG